ncbi:hypothetical protein LTR01_001091 [Friedmanniomyces endolithicus]|nr:hypothetical protein LTR01_001091 [Friedmanniomyces endolithicus]
MVRNINTSRAKASSLPLPASYYYGPSRESTNSPVIYTPSALDDQFKSRATSSWAPQDDHFKYLRKDIVRDAENALRRSGMDPSAFENIRFLLQAIEDAETLSKYTRNPMTRSNRSPGAHDRTHDFGLPYRSPVDRLDGGLRQSTSSHAEAIRALRAMKHEDQDLRTRDEWRAEPSPLPPMPHEYSYQSRYPRLRTDRAAPTSAAFPSKWSSKLPPMKESSPEVLHKQIRVPESALSKPEIKLVVIDTESREKFPLYLTREYFRLMWPRSDGLRRSEDGGVEPKVIYVEQDSGAVHSLIEFVERGSFDTPITVGHPLDHHRKVMTLAATWGTPGLEIEAWSKITFAIAALPSAELYRLADLVVSIQRDHAHDPSLRRVNGDIFEAVALRGGELLGDGESLRKLAAGDGAPLRRLARHVAARLLGSEDAVDDMDESAAGIRTPATTPPGTSSPASRSMRVCSDKDH